MSLQDYIPHGLIGALGAIVTYVYREHVKQDDDRFQQLNDARDTLDKKLDDHFRSTADQLVRIALAVGAKPTNQRDE